MACGREGSGCEGAESASSTSYHVDLRYCIVGVAMTFVVRVWLVDLNEMQSNDVCVSKRNVDDSTLACITHSYSPSSCHRL